MPLKLPFLFGMLIVISPTMIVQSLHAQTGLGGFNHPVVHYRPAVPLPVGIPQPVATPQPPAVPQPVPVAQTAYMPVTNLTTASYQPNNQPVPVSIPTLPPRYSQAPVWPSYRPYEARYAPYYAPAQVPTTSLNYGYSWPY